MEQILVFKARKRKDKARRLFPCVVAKVFFKTTHAHDSLLVLEAHSKERQKHEFLHKVLVVQF
jgi:hypothetical protein